MNVRRIAQLLRERAVLDEALAAEFERDADEMPSGSVAPKRRRTRVVAPRPSGKIEIDDLSRERAAKIVR